MDPSSPTDLDSLTPIDFQAYPIISLATSQRLRDSLRRCELLRDHILQQSADSLSQSRAFYSTSKSAAIDWGSQPGEPQYLFDTASPQKPAGYPTPSHSPELDTTALSGHQPKSESPAPPPDFITSPGQGSRLPTPDYPSKNAARNAPCRSALESRRTQLKQLSRRTTQPPNSEGPVHPPLFIPPKRVRTTRDPRTQPDRNASGPSSLKNRSLAVNRHVSSAPQEPKLLSPVSSPKSTADRRLSTPTDPTTNLARNAPSLKSRSSQVAPSSSIPPEPTAVWPLQPTSTNVKSLPTPIEPETDAAWKVPSPTSLKRRCSDVNNRSVTPPKKPHINTDPSPKRRQSQSIDFNNLPALDGGLTTAIEAFVKSWPAKQLVEILNRIVLYRRQVLGWGPVDSHQPVKLDDVRQALLAVDPEMVTNLIRAHRHHNPDRLAFRDVFAGPSVQHTIQLFGQGPLTTVALRRDFTALGLIYFPLIKALRACYVELRRKPSFGEFRERFDSRAKQAPFVTPPRLVDGAVNLQTYLQIAANDRVVLVSQPAHAQATTMLIDDLVRLSLHPDWWKGSIPFCQPFEPAQPTECTTCHTCHQKDLPCQVLHPDPGSVSDHDKRSPCRTNKHTSQDDGDDDDDEYNSLFDSDERIDG